MKLFHFLFGSRRWLLCVPVVIAALLENTGTAKFDFLSFVQLLCGLGVPYWLAYWLSDGFEGIEVRPFNSW